MNLLGKLCVPRIWFVVIYWFWEINTIYFSFPHPSLQFFFYHSDWQFVCVWFDHRWREWNITSVKNMLSICALELDQFGLVLSLLSFNPWVEQFTCIYWTFGCICYCFSSFIVAGFKFPFVFLSQVHEDDLQNYFEPMGNVKVDNALYNYTKQKAFDTMGKLLEMRLNSHGYIIFSCFIISKSTVVLWLLAMCFQWG